ncbi:MAG: SGNH/GDSL hydrolase family protein [Bdellovibrionales bacterium]|nr:SGNH/GDSL hydrolase family protein [Bdellovibrionales bacterium]
MRTRKWLVKLLFFCGSCLLSLVIFETALRVISTRKNLYTIEMLKYAKTLKMRDPLGVLTHVHRPNSEAHLMGVDVRLNNLGHRSPALLVNKPSQSERIFVLGSSITMGWGVPEEKVFTTQLVKRLQHAQPQKTIEIANAGTGNYNSFCQFELFRRQFDEVNPDQVILHYFINDAEPNPENSNPLARYSFLAAYLNSELQGMYFRYANRKSLPEYYRDLYTPNSQDWKNTRGYLRQMQRMAKAKEVPFLVMIVPDTHDLGIHSAYAPIYETIQAQFQNDGLDTLNAFDAFSASFGGKENTLWVQADDPHPNAGGHAVMADLLFQRLQAPLLPGQS